MRRWAENMGEAALLLLVFAGLVGGAGYLLLSWPGLWGGLVLAGLVMLGSGHVMPAVVLWMYGGRPLRLDEAPTLYSLTQLLAERAGLDRVPQLYYVPSQVISIFTVGRRGAAHVALSEGLICGLNTRELAGMLAHEMAHIRRGDLSVFSVADSVSRVAVLLAVLGVLLVLIGLPMSWLVYPRLSLSWGGVALLIFSPTVLGLCQLMLGRHREVEADAEAVGMTGDPIGLLHGLRKFDLVEFRPLQRIVLSGYRTKEPSLVRGGLSLSHRLRRLRGKHASASSPVRALPLYTQLGLGNLHSLVTRPPRWHWTGLWY